NGFESGAGPEWSPSQTSVTPIGARPFLGEFGNQTVKLTLTNLPAHTVARVSFDLLVIRSWDGNNFPFGPDVWSVAVAGGPTLLQTTFNNTGGSQSYPGTFQSQNPPGFPPRTGAAESNTLGYFFSGTPQDTIYHFDFTFPDSSNVLVLNFAGSGLQALTDE